MTKPTAYYLAQGVTQNTLPAHLFQVGEEVPKQVCVHKAELYVSLFSPERRVVVQADVDSFIYWSCGDYLAQALIGRGLTSAQISVPETDLPGVLFDAVKLAVIDQYGRLPEGFVSPITLSLGTKEKVCFATYNEQDLAFFHLYILYPDTHLQLILKQLQENGGSFVGVPLFPKFPHETASSPILLTHELQLRPDSDVSS